MAAQGQYTKITAKGVIAMILLGLEQGADSWARDAGMYFMSNQETESYGWLSTSPVMREWIGNRQAKGLKELNYSVTNRKFEASLQVAIDDFRRDKTSAVLTRINQLVQRANAHWAKLASELLLAGTTVTGYDGKALFATDHTDGGDSGTHKNILTASEYSTLDVTTATAPTALELANATMSAIQHFYTFKDDQGEPLIEDSNDFLVMVPVPFFAAARQMQTMRVLQGASGTLDNPITESGFRVRVVANPRLTWTTDFCVFDISSPTRALILQEEEGVTTQALLDGSDYAVLNDAYLYGIKSLRNVAPGYWQKVLKLTLS